jgi:hypothetical protein
VEKIMVDPKKSAEAAKRIQEINRTIQTHQTRISSIEYEKANKVRYYDQQIKHEQDEIRRHSKLIDDLKRQI